jgi:hypothetical protein
LISVSLQKVAERRNIQSMMSRSEGQQVLFREPKQTRRGRQTSAVFRMRWMCESLLQMNKSARRLN